MADIELRPATRPTYIRHQRSASWHGEFNAAPAIGASTVSLHSTQHGDSHIERGSVHHDTSRILDYDTQAGIEDEPTKWVTGTKLHVLGAACLLASLTMSIDGSILAAAIPRITSDFGSVDYIGWYGSIYLLTEMAFQPLFGRVYKFYERKVTYILSLIVFEGGSILCAAAPNSLGLIMGRAIAGIGAAGILMGSITIFGQAIPLRQRSLALSLLESVSSLAGMLGSTLGGVITDSSLTWRFCFWLNIPLGAVTAAMMILVLDRKKPEASSLPFVQKTRGLDIQGSVLLASCLVCLFLALEWGGVSKPWSNPSVWGCLIAFAILAVGFFAFQWYRKDNAVVPLRIFKQRTIALCCIFSMMYGFAIYADFYMLPIWFQGVMGTSATISGVNCLAFSVPSVFATVFTGYITTKFGYPVPFMWAGSALYAIGSGLLFTLTPSSTPAQYLGFQIVAGIGMGLAIQITFVAVQIVTPIEDMPTACGMELFFKQLGGTIGINVAQNLFVGKLTSGLEAVAPELVSGGINIASGISDLAKMAESLPPAQRAAFKDAVNDAVMRAFLVPTVVAAVAAVASWAMEWLHIEDDRPKSPEL